MVVSESEEAPVAAGGAHLTATAMCKKSNRVARLLAHALLEWILIALLLANGVFAYLIAKFAAFCGLPPPCALCSRLGVDSLFEPSCRRGAGGGAEHIRRVVCDAHASEVSRLGYCRAHRRLADAADMCEDCGAAAAAASGKALLSWMRRSELGERDLACACCGVALESGFYSPPFLLPRTASSDLDCGYEQDDSMACLHEDVVFVSEDGPVIELFDEKPLVAADDSVGVMPAHCADIAGNVVVPLDSMAVGVSELSSEPSGEGKEEFDHGTMERDYVAPKNEVNANEEKYVVASDDEKMDDILCLFVTVHVIIFIIWKLSDNKHFHVQQHKDPWAPTPHHPAPPLLTEEVDLSAMKRKTEFAPATAAFRDDEAFRVPPPVSRPHLESAASPADEGVVSCGGESCVTTESEEDAASSAVVASANVATADTDTWRSVESAPALARKRAVIEPAPPPSRERAVVEPAPAPARKRAVVQPAPVPARERVVVERGVSLPPPAAITATDEHFDGADHDDDDLDATWNAIMQKTRPATAPALSSSSHRAPRASPPRPAPSPRPRAREPSVGAAELSKRSEDFIKKIHHSFGRHQ